MEHRSVQFRRNNNDHHFRCASLRAIVVSKLSGFWETSSRGGKSDAEYSQLDAAWHFNVRLRFLSSPALLDECYR